MSRREDRTSELKRHRSRFDREPSPKRSRRDGKPDTERTPTEPGSDKDRVDRDHRHHRRLQDPLPVEAGSKVVSASMNNHSSDPSKVPLPRSYFQHDDRGSAGQNGRSSSRRVDNERGWWRDPKEQEIAGTNTTLSSDAKQKDDKSKDRGNRAWRHDGYFEMEANPKPPLRKRPAFREQKVPADPEKTSKIATDPVMSNPRDHAADRVTRNERWNEPYFSDKSERPFAGGRELNNRAQSWRGNFSSRERYRGRDRFSGRQGQGQGNHPTGGRADKWKHDLYTEANQSPPPKNEDDQISKIEALLAS